MDKNAVKPLLFPAEEDKKAMEHFPSEPKCDKICEINVNKSDEKVICRNYARGYPILFNKRLLK